MNQTIIGLFNDGYVPIMDGVTLTVRNYAYWLSKSLGPSYVITPWVPLHKDREPFPVIRYLSLPTIVRPPYRIGLPELDPLAQQTLRNRDFSLVHAHSPFSAGRMALRIAKEKRIPVVATFHSKYRDDLWRAVPVKPLVDEEIKRIVDFYHDVDEVWVPQAGVAKTLREYGYRGPYRVMENGVDLEAPADLAPLRRAAELRLGFGQETSMGLFVGQHILEKNLEFLMRSLPAVCAAEPRFRMVFVGEGYAKPRLKSLARELGVVDRVVFHDVVYDRELIKEFYARAELFLFPSKYDNAPLVMREAAAFKTPAVALRGSTAAEVIRDGVNGFLSDDDPEAYAATVVAALRDEKARVAAGLDASRSIYRSWESVVVEVKRRYLEILSQWA